MRRLPALLGFLAGLLMIASAFAHALGGWPLLARVFGDRGVDAHTVGAAQVGWYWGSCAMLGFGAVTVGEALAALRGRAVRRRAVAAVAAVYVVFGAAAFAGRDLNPHFLLFIATGLLAGALLLPRRTWPALVAATLLATLPHPAAAADDMPTALVIVDIQDFYFPGGALPLVEPEAAAANAGRLLEHFRAAGRPVCHVGHAAAAGRDFAAAVQPRDGEDVFIKHEVNAFQDTPLLDRLQQQGILRVVLCGMQTHMCLEAAARAARDYGFEVVVVGDACATRDLTFAGVTTPAALVHASTLATLDRVYARVVDTATALAEY